MVDYLAVHGRETRRAVRHHALPLRTSYLRAEVRLGRLAVDAVPFAALRGVARDDKVARLVLSHAFPDVVYDSCRLMTEDRGELSFWVLSRLCVHIRVA